MQIIPAIDIQQGQVVRLKQGDFDQATVYANDPLLVANKMVEQGMQQLHIVDLDGAKAPSKQQLPLLASLAALKEIELQIGGGVRCRDDVAALLDLGAKRVVIGSLAISQPDIFDAILSEFGQDKIVLALDVVEMNGEFVVKTHGWQQQSKQELFAKLASAAIENVLCTDISRDGLLTGPNFPLYQALLARFPQLKLQASGGVSCQADLAQLQQLGVPAAIVGRAYYEGVIRC